MDSSSDLNEAINSYKDDFINVVLHHVTGVLLPEKWQFFRLHAVTSKSRVVDETPKPDARPEEVIRDSLCNCFTSPRVIIAQGGKKTEVIGEVAGQNVYFWPSEGYYFWGNDSDGGCIWDVNLCWPASTPNLEFQH